MITLQGPNILMRLYVKKVTQIMVRKFLIAIQKFGNPSQIFIAPIIARLAIALIYLIHVPFVNFLQFLLNSDNFPEQSILISQEINL